MSQISSARACSVCGTRSARWVCGRYIPISKMKISARNVLKGKVKQVIAGAVINEVIVELPGGIEVVSIITKTSSQNLGLKVGKEVYAVIKASNVMVATDE